MHELSRRARQVPAASLVNGLPRQPAPLRTSQPGPAAPAHDALLDRLEDALRAVMSGTGGPAD